MVATNNHAIPGNTAMETADNADTTEMKNTKKRQEGSLLSMWHMIVSSESWGTFLLLRKRPMSPVQVFTPYLDGPDLCAYGVCQKFRDAG